MPRKSWGDAGMDKAATEELIAAVLQIALEGGFIPFELRRLLKIDYVEGEGVKFDVDATFPDVAKEWSDSVFSESSRLGALALKAKGEYK